MKKIILLFSFLVFLTNCALKHTQELVHSGDYDNAISIAVSSLESNKDKKSKQDYVYLLEEAFAKAKERDLNTLPFDPNLYFFSGATYTFPSGTIGQDRSRGLEAGIKKPGVFCKSGGFGCSPI